MVARGGGQAGTARSWRAGSTADAARVVGVVLRDGDALGGALGQACAVQARGVSVNRSTGHTHTHTPSDNTTPDTDTHRIIDIAYHAYTENGEAEVGPLGVSVPVDEHVLIYGSVRRFDRTADSVWR